MDITNQLVHERFRNMCYGVRSEGVERFLDRVS